MTSTDDSIILTPSNYPLWHPWFETQFYRFGEAGEELNIRNIETDLGDPDINERFESLDKELHYRFDHNVDGKPSAVGRKEYLEACKAKKLDDKDTKKDRQKMLVYLFDHMSTDSKNKMRSQTKFKDANTDCSSFRIMQCVKESHNQIESIPVVGKHLKTFTRTEQKPGMSLSDYTVQHRQAAEHLKSGLEDPDNPGFYKITVFDSLNYLAGLSDPKLLAYVDRDWYDTELHNLEINEVTEALSNHLSSRCEKENSYSPFNSPSSTNLAMTVIESNSKPITPGKIKCKQCHQDFFTNYKRGTTECFDTCINCSRNNSKDRSQKKLESETKAKAAAVVPKQGTTPQVNLTTSLTDPVDIKTYKDMLDFQMFKNQVNVTFQYHSDSHPVLTAMSTPFDDHSFCWDNAATLSVCTLEASTVLTEVEPVYNADPVGYGGFTGASATPNARGKFPNFPIADFWIYIIPGSNTNILSLIDLDRHGGSYYGAK